MGVFGRLASIAAFAGLGVYAPVAALAQERPATAPADNTAGIYVNVTAGGRVSPNALNPAKRNPHVRGVQALVTWSELEPRKGQYDWTAVEELLAQCEPAGKRVALRFVTVSGKMKRNKKDGKRRDRRRDPDAGGGFPNTATPTWLFEDPGVQVVGDITTSRGTLPKYPVFWDVAYQRHLEQFIKAMARRYDGDSRIGYIRIGGWQVGTSEPSFYGGGSQVVAKQLADRGIHVNLSRRGKPLLQADGHYAGAVTRMIDLWADAFRKTQLVATIHFPRRPDSFEQAMNDHAARRGVALVNTGLNEGDHRPARQTFRNYRDNHGCRVGWGGISGMGKRGRDMSRHQQQLEAVKQGIGIDGDPRYSPASGASYLVVGPNFLENSEALAWAANNLRP